MKVDGKTIPAPQNIKRREAFLLEHASKLPVKYVQAELLKIAYVKAQKKLRWELPNFNMATLEVRKEKKSSEFIPLPKKQGLISRIKKVFKK